MSRISKRDALQLAADIQSGMILAHAIARRSGGDGSHYAGFVGSLEIVIASFVGRAGGDAVGEIVAAFNYRPTEAEVSERIASLGQSRAAA